MFTERVQNFKQPVLASTAMARSTGPTRKPEAGVLIKGFEHQPVAVCRGGASHRI